MVCPVCGAAVRSYKPGAEATTTTYGCGFTDADIAAGRHPPAARRQSAPAWVPVLIVTALAFVLSFAFRALAVDGPATVALQRSILAALLAVGLGILYALWRILRVLEVRP